MDLTTTNAWLAVLALVSLVEFLMIVAAGVFAYRMYRRTTALIARVESDYVAPLTARVTVVVDEAREVVRRAQQVETRVRGMVDRVEETASRVGAVAEHVWPVVGTWRAVSAAVRSLRRPPASRALRPAPRF